MPTQLASYQGVAVSVATGAKAREETATTSPRAWSNPIAPLNSASNAATSAWLRRLPLALSSATATDRLLTVPVASLVTLTSRPSSKLRLKVSAVLTGGAPGAAAAVPAAAWPSGLAAWGLGSAAGWGG